MSEQSKYITIINPHGVEVEVLKADLPGLLKKGFRSTQAAESHNKNISVVANHKFIYMKNPKGLLVEVAYKDMNDLLKRGYELVTPNRYNISPGASGEKVEWGFPVSPNYRYDGYGRLVSYVADRLSPSPTPHVHLLFGPPREIEKKPDCIHVLFTMFESDRIPTLWVEYVNKYFDYVIVPAQFSEDIFKKCGVTKPITQIPLFATHFDIYKPDTSPFVFSMQNTMVDGAQKGWDLLIRAFLTLYKGNMDVKLILKARNHDWAHVSWYDQYLEKEPNIELIKDDWIYEDMHTKLYARTNCFVFPSRGEGWGLPPLEAMAHGIPTILTKAHSHVEFSEYGIEIGSKPDSFSYYIDRVKEAGIGHWVEPNFDELVTAMDMVYKNYSREKTRAIKEARIIEKKFNGDLFIKRLKKFMDKLCEK